MFQEDVSTDITIDLEEFEELWVEKAEKVAAKKKVRRARCGTVSGCGGRRRVSDYPEWGARQCPACTCSVATGTAILLCSVW